MAADEPLIEQLRTLLAELRGFEDPRRATPQWKVAFNLLKKTDLEPNHIANVVAKRDVADLAAVLDELGAAVAPPPPAAAELPPGVDEHMLKSALKAFKKRLKLTRLDDESQVHSRDPLSSGQTSQIRAILPPNEWPKAVWETLAKQGKLRYAKNGFYELGSEPE